MNGNRINLFLTSLVVLVVILAVAGIGGASPPETMLEQAGAPTLVSYQGQVKVAGVPYNGTGYFKFAIRTATTGGTNAWTNDGTAPGGGQPTSSVPLTVNNGLFNVLLGDTSLANMTALPASVFNNTQRYLRVWFSSDNTTFTQLSPDQRIAAVPYAMQAEYAKQAENAVMAEKVTGYANVVVVAKSGGDYTTITGALNSITTASASNRYLVRVMPGVYTERVTMKQYVDIEGSGELNTKITYTGSASFTDGTLSGANNAELRWLTVENTGGNSYAVAISNLFASPRLTHITASVSGGTEANYALYNNYSVLLEMTSVRAISGGTFNFVVYNYSSSVVMRDCVLNASGGLINVGISNATAGGPYTVTVDGTQITASNNTILNTAGFTTKVGASLLSGGSVSGGGTIKCVGVYNGNYDPLDSTCH